MMTIKYLETITEELNAALELNQDNKDARQATERIIEGLANSFADIDRNFNKEEFMSACGV